MPLYDEEARFAEYGKLLVDFIAEQPPGRELVFVDDGSRDRTATLVEELARRDGSGRVRLLRRPHQGKGAAVAAGLATTTAAYAGFCDLDLSTPLDHLERVMHAAQRAPVLAIGSRDLATSRLLRAESPVREALGKTYNRLLQVTVVPGIVDTQCGAKVASRAVWDAVLPHCRESGYAWDAEALAVARAIGVPVQEIPIDWRHDDRSKVRVARDGAAMVWATTRIWRSARRARLAARGATAPEVFDDRNAELLMAADAEHWWFRGKAALVSTAIRRTGGGDGWLVDAGAGSGGVTAMLGWDPARVVVVEGNELLVRQARQRGLGGVRGSVDRLPLPDGSVEAACLLDVIEHLADPGLALAEARRVLVPGGRLVVNVPAHRWLWSAADEALGHHRRYTRADLRRSLEDAGFRVVLLTHVFSWLVPPVWATRRLSRGGQPELGLDRTSALVDRTAMVLTAVERLAVGRLALPFGTSVLAVAETAGRVDERH